MRTAVIVVSLIAAAVAEAPYHLPRPAPHAPSFNFQPGPALRPQPAPQPTFNQNSGYNYQQPSIQPAFAPQPHFHPQPAPQPHYHQPAPQPHYQQPAPQPHYHQPAPQPHYHQPAPQPHYHQPAPHPHYHQPAPQPNFIQNSGYQYQQPSIQPAFAPQPQPIPNFNYISQPQIQPAPQQLIPSTSYGIPQPQIARPLPQPAFIPSQPAPAPVQYQQQSSQQGYSYAQSAQQLPLQVAQSYVNNGVSSYQADNAQYSGSQSQIQGEGLDAVVIDRVQNIIKESEHSSARNAGYLSLVSGVSLESARPSVEISSFVQNAPLGGSSVGSGSGSLSVSQGSGSSQSVAVSAPSSGYLPAVSSNNQGSSSGSGFLPSSKPASAYGAPN